MQANIKTKLDLFFLSVTILALLISPFVMFFLYKSGKLGLSLLVPQAIVWLAFSVYTVFFIKKLVRKSGNA